jgi:Domain of Unknown Function (DUF928)
MRKHLLTICALSLGISLLAQQENPVVLVSAQGKMTYTSPTTKKPAKVRAGAVLRPSGNLKLGKNATAILYCNEQFVTVKDKGNNDLGKTCASGSSAQSLGFQLEFGNYVMAGVELAAFADSKGFQWIKTVTDPKVGGDGWGNSVTEPKGSGSSGWGSMVTGSESNGWGNSVTDPKGSGSSGWGNSVTDPKGSGSSGWGTTKSRITSIMPYGKLIASNTTFFWANPSASTSFHFEITDELNTKVYEIDLRDTFLQVDLSALKLEQGSKYNWKVSVPGNKTLDSALLNFEIGTTEKRAAALKKATTMTILQSGDDVSLRKVAEAVALERGEWYYDAYETYAEVRRTNPNNLTRMMHAAFLRRYGLTPMVEKAALK